MQTRVLIFCAHFLFGFIFSAASMADGMTDRFDHEKHIEQIFKPQGIKCSTCHNFSQEEGSKKLIPNENFSKSTFSKPLKDICHSCHRSAETTQKEAPKECYACHRNIDNLKAIKPKNHENMAWKNAHATEARINGQACMNCHITSHCVKCHLRRNDIELSNHSRNFKFFHSVQARTQPQRCDACHSKSFCINCHSGKP